MIALLSTLVSAGMRWLLDRFMPSRDERLGKMEVENEALEKENAAMAQAMRVSDRVDSLSDDDGVRQALNARPR